MKSIIAFWILAFISCILTTFIINKGTIPFIWVCTLYFSNFIVLFFRSIEVLQKLVNYENKNNISPSHTFTR